MTGAGFLTELRKRTKTDSVQLTEADALARFNIAKDEVCALLAQRNPQYFLVPALQNTVTSSVTAREYPLADDLMGRLASVEFAAATASPLVYVPVRPYPGGMDQLLIDIDGLTEAKIIGTFSNTEPYYVLTRRGIYILSAAITAVTDGLKTRFQAFPADLANLQGSTDLGVDPSTTTFGIPKLLHELLLRRVSMGYKGDHPGSVPLSPLELAYNVDLKAALDILAIDDQRGELIGSVPYNDGSDY